MRLQELRLKNFMGIRDFTMTPHGEDANVYGDNGTGKTTLKSAIEWLLFGKDARGRADFAIKTHEPGTDVPIPHLEHEVEGIFDTITLRRALKEKWVKKVFKGHTTDYYVNDVAVMEKEYKAKIAAIIDESIFRMLTDPTYFCDRLKWEERQNIVMDMAPAPGDISDSDVAIQDPSFAAVVAILEKRTIDEHRKMLSASVKKMEENRQSIPTRIDEVHHGLPEAIDDKGRVERIEALNSQRKAKQEQIVQLMAGGGVAEKTKAIAEIETELSKIEKRVWLQSAGKTQAAKIQLNTLTDENNRVDLDITNKTNAILTTREAITDTEGKRDKLREAWQVCDAQALEYVGTDTCPTCKQPLPADQVEAAREKAMADFNRSKAQRLESINEEGQAANAKIGKLTGESDALQHELLEAKARQEELGKEIAETRDTVMELDRREFDYKEDPGYLKKQAEKDTLKIEIERLKGGQSSAIEAIRATLGEIGWEIGEHENALAKVGQRAEGLKRVEELGEEEKRLSAKIEEAEKELCLCEQFVVAKKTMLQDRIHALFTITRFKLFEPLVNGGINDKMFTPLGLSSNGAWVPFNDGLNGGMRNNVGLDCINTLSNFFGLDVPIFIDEAGETTALLPTRGQQIRLYVSEQDKVLRVEKP